MTSPDRPRSPADVPDLTLAEFLLARLDEDERVARAATENGGHWAFHDATGLVFEVDQPLGDSFSGALPWGEGRCLVEPVGGPEGVIQHIARQDPAATLARVAAHRRIVGLLDEKHAERMRMDPEYEWYGSAIEDAVRLLTLPYVAHPDYRADEWRPES